MKNLFLILTLFLAGCTKQAAVDSADSESDKFSFGKVVSVSTASLEVNEYDFAKDDDIVTNYQVTTHTEFGNFIKLTELQPGDDVVIDYLEEGDRRRATTLVKEEKGGDAEHHPGRLVIAPDFQQIGSTGDGGGIIRAVAGTMSLTIDDPAEQERFAALSRQPGPAPAPRSESVDLSGISQWLPSADYLPDASVASQVRAFGRWQVVAWGRGLSDSTIALYRNQELQFAWKGAGLSTTGPLRPAESWKPFDGPPAGTDLDGDGVPDLLIQDYSGGAHCCATVKHVVCSDPPVLVAQISGWHNTPIYQDIDGDGHHEMTIGDSSYAYWNACFAASPEPEVIFRIAKGRYEMAGDLMRRKAQAADKIEATIRELQHRLSRYDLLEARVRTNQETAVELTGEEQADEDFFIGQTWHPDDGSIRVPPAVWTLLLDLIYSGRIDAAVNALDTMWPPGKPHKAEFANDLMAMIRSSWYGQRLPWFEELDATFAQHFPPMK